ncbi:hypothetical protein [Streptomyces melanogenes]|uniref:hypothetical protein n=1 Tax=Streptomyces melanogenes TaxID=67326 RepID=UPI0037ABF609
MPGLRITRRDRTAIELGVLGKPARVRLTGLPARLWREAITRMLDMGIDPNDTLLRWRSSPKSWTVEERCHQAQWEDPTDSFVRAQTQGAWLGSGLLRRAALLHTLSNTFFVDGYSGATADKTPAAVGELRHTLYDRQDQPLAYETHIAPGGYWIYPQPTPARRGTSKQGPYVGPGHPAARPDTGPERAAIRPQSAGWRARTDPTECSSPGLSVPHHGARTRPGPAASAQPQGVSDNISTAVIEPEPAAASRKASSSSPSHTVGPSIRAHPVEKPTITLNDYFRSQLAAPGNSPTLARRVRPPPATEPSSPRPQGRKADTAMPTPSRPHHIRPRAAVLLGASTLALTATLATAPTAHAVPAILDFSRSLTLRNMLNGPIQANILANVRNEGAFNPGQRSSIPATSEEVIVETTAAGLQVGVGETTFPATPGPHPLTITERPGIGHITPGEPVQITVIGIEKAGALPIGITTLTETLHCGQPDTQGTITCT